MYPVAMISLRRMCIGIGVFFAVIALALTMVYHSGVGDSCEELWSQVDADELNVNLLPDRCWQRGPGG